MRKLLALTLSLLMVFSVIPAAMVSAEGETYLTMFDASSEDASSQIGKGDINSKVTIVDLENEDHPKAFYVKRTNEWNGMAGAFTGDIRSVAKGAIGIKFWVAGDEATVAAGQKFSVGIGTNSTYYKADADVKNNFGPVTAEGAYYTWMWNTGSVYINKGPFQGHYEASAAKTVITENFLAIANTRIFVGTGQYSNTEKSNGYQSGLYVDDIQLIYPEGVTPAPVEYTASFEGTETAVLAEAVDSIKSDAQNNDAVVLPEATLVEGEFAGWATAKDFTTVYAPGTTVNLTTSTTYYAVRADKPALETPAAPTTSKVEGTSVTLTAVTGAVYSKDGATWQTSNVFSGLESGATYTFYQKMAETLAYAESAVSAALTVTTPVSYLFDWIRGTDKVNDFNETITSASGTLTTNDYSDNTCMTTSRSLVAGDVLSYTTKADVVPGIYKVDFELRGYTGRANLNIKVGDRDYGTFESPGGGSNTVVNLFEDYAHEEEGPVTITFTAETTGSFYIEQLHLTKVGDVDLGTTRKIKIDDEVVAEVEVGSEYTIPTPPTGYCYTDGKTDYYGGEEVVVEKSISLTSKVITTEVVYTMDEGKTLTGATTHFGAAEVMDVNGNNQLALKAKADAYAYIQLPSDWSSKPYYKPTKITFTVSSSSATDAKAYKSLYFAGVLDSVDAPSGSYYTIASEGNLTYFPKTVSLNVTEDMYDYKYITGKLYTGNWTEVNPLYVYFDDVTITYEYDFDYVAPTECKVTIDGEEVATVMSGEYYDLPELEAGKYYVGYEGVEKVLITEDLNLTTATYTYDITIDGEVVATVDYGTEYTLPTLEAGKYYVETEETTFVVTEDKTFTTATYTYDITIDGEVVATVEYGAEYTLPALHHSKYYVDVTETTFVVTSDLTFTTATKDVVDSVIVYDADANGKNGAIGMWGGRNLATLDGRQGVIFSKGSSYRGAGVDDSNMFGSFADYADTAIGVRFWAIADSDETVNPIRVYIGAPSNVSDNYVRETLVGETVEIAGSTWTQFTVMFDENATAEEIASMTHILFVTYDANIIHYLDDVELLLTEEVDSAYDITIDGEVVATAEHNTTYTLPELEAGKYYVEGYAAGKKFTVTSDLAFTTAFYTYDITIDGVVVATVEHGATFTLPAVKEGKQYADGYTVGQEFTVTEALSFTTEDIPEVDGPTTSLVSTQEGASIRLNEVNGMRFYATFNGDLADVDEMGIIIAPKNIVGDYFTMEDDHIKVVYDHKNNELWDNNTFVGSIVNVADRNLARDFIARAYVVIDGVTYYAETSTVRNLAAIADEYINDANGGYAELDADTQALVDTWAKAND